MSRFVYKRTKTREISFPLGGLGTGCVGLAGNGALVDWEIFGRPNKGSLNGFSHFAVRAENEKEVLDARILQSDLAPPYTGERGFTGLTGFGWGPRRENMQGAPHFKNAVFKGEFPLAELTFKERAFPGKVKLRAFNPFIPLNDKDSGIPASFFEIQLQNTSKQTLKYAVVGAVSNPLRGNNRNRFERDQRLSLLHLSSDGYEEDDPDRGDLTLITDATEVSQQEYWFKGAWFDELEVYWRDFSTAGPFKKRRYPLDRAGSGCTGLLCAHLELNPQETKSVRFALSWSFPLMVKYWGQDQERVAQEAQKRNISYPWRHHYATLWEDSKASAQYAMEHWDRLQEETRLFKKTLFRSSLPGAVLDAVSANLSTLKSATVLRLEDGTFYGWEGVCTGSGCCEGSCTHVWNYAQALPFLFPQLERSVRETNYEHNQDEIGGMRFRLQLPLGIGRSDFRPCADGQFGDVLKTYRDWKICGDSAWLAKLWPKIKKSIEYAWNPDNQDRWDPEKTGVLQGRQHHTLDMELFGPNSWLTGFYLAALKAGAEMAEHLNDGTFAQELRELFVKGKRWADQHLFNGQYYRQIVDLSDRSIAERFDALNYWNEEHKELKYQIGDGCEIDQVLGQWHANLYGLGEIFDKTQVKRSLRSIYENNFKDPLREHFNACRVYSLNDEAGLVICDWPEGVRRPITPLPYAGETMNGFEYAAAIHMIQEGLTKQGLRCVKALRRRFDGERRNPWNEFECGSNYARSMASYALLLTWSGFQFDRTKDKIGFLPLRVAGKTFRCFWSLDGAWGEFILKPKRAEIRLLYGEIRLRQIVLPYRSKRVVLEKTALPFRLEGKTVILNEAKELKAEQSFFLYRKGSPAS